MAEKTRRQALLELLRSGDHACEDLRLLTGLGGRDLEAELRHVARTARRAGERLVVTPARCQACGHTFHDRVRRRLQPPGRCPACRSERIEDPRFRLEPE